MPPRKKQGWFATPHIRWREVFGKGLVPSKSPSHLKPRDVFIHQMGFASFTSARTHPERAWFELISTSSLASSFRAYYVHVIMSILVHIIPNFTPFPKSL